MTERLDRSEIEARHGKLWDGLSFAKARLRQLSEAPSTTDEELAEAEQSVRGFERRLEGIGFARERLGEQERKEAEAEDEARRRKAAAAILSLVHLHFGAAEELDEAEAARGRALDAVESWRQEIVAVVTGRFVDGTRQGDDRLRNFLMNISAIDMTDIAYRVSANNGRVGHYANSLVATRPAALRALAKILPEIEDPSVQEEALALARQEAAVAPDAAVSDRSKPSGAKPQRSKARRRGIGPRK